MLDSNNIIINSKFSIFSMTFNRKEDLELITISHLKYNVYKR